MLKLGVFRTEGVAQRGRSNYVSPSAAVSELRGRERRSKSAEIAGVVQQQQQQQQREWAVLPRSHRPSQMVR
eukprot:6175017-Pleurochrysis_carterae.AAC.1